MKIEFIEPTQPVQKTVPFDEMEYGQTYKSTITDQYIFVKVKDTSKSILLYTNEGSEELKASSGWEGDRFFKHNKSLVVTFE